MLFSNCWGVICHVHRLLRSWDGRHLYLFLGNRRGWWHTNTRNNFGLSCRYYLRRRHADFVFPLHVHELKDMWLFSLRTAFRKSRLSPSQVKSSAYPPKISCYELKNMIHGKFDPQLLAISGAPLLCHTVSKPGASKLFELGFACASLVAPQLDS